MKKLSQIIISAILVLSAFSITMTVDSTQSYAKTMYAKTGKYNLNVRAKPTTKSKVIGKVKNNGAITVVKSYNKYWYKVKFKGKTGYVYKSYVKSKKTAKKVNKPGYYSVNVGSSSLNVRIRPTTNAAVQDKLYTGNVVYVYEVKNGWAYVEFDVYDKKFNYLYTDYGYVHAKYLK